MTMLFWDIVLQTRSCDIGVHRAGSQLKKLTSTIAPRVVENVSTIADTAKPATFIFTLTKHAQVFKHFTLVDIGTFMFVTGRRVHVSHGTFAPK